MEVKTPNLSIFMPFNINYTPREINPEVKESCIEWLLNHHLFSDEKTAEYMVTVAFEYITCCYPSTENDKFYYLICFCSWNCILDDFTESNKLSNFEMIEFLSQLKYICDRNQSVIKTLPQRFQTGVYLAKALCSLKKMLREWLTGVQLYSLMSSLSHFISGLIWEVSIRTNNNTMYLNDFLSLRLCNVGVHMACSLYECIDNINLSTTLRSTETFQAVTESLLLVMAIDNDLYSHCKEIGGRNFNILNLMNSWGVPYPVDEVLKLRNDLTKLHIELRKRFYQSPDEELDKYFKGLENLISGNIIFGNICKRYGGSLKKSQVEKGTLYSMRFYKDKINISKSYKFHNRFLANIPTIVCWQRLLEK